MEALQGSGSSDLTSPRLVAEDYFLVLCSRGDDPVDDPDVLAPDLKVMVHLLHYLEPSGTISRP